MDTDPPLPPDPVVGGLSMTLIFDFVSDEVVIEKQRVTIPTPRIFISVVLESSIFKYVSEFGVVIKEYVTVGVVVGVEEEAEAVTGDMIDVGSDVLGRLVDVEGVDVVVVSFQFR